jgi:predicted kinase
MSKDEYATAGTCNSALVVLVGVPGSGKSTLAHALVSLCPGEVKVHAADDIEREILAHRGPSSQSFDPAVWKRARSLMYARAAESATRCIAVLDDTFHYTSMRRSALCLARDCQVPILFVHIRCDPSLARTRNAARPQSDRVPEHSFDRILSVYEPPSPSCNWTVHVDFSSSDMSLQRAAEHVLRAVHAQSSSAIPALHQPPTNAYANDEKEEPDSERYGRLLHEADVRTRKLLTSALSCISQSASKASKREIASKLNELRRSMLDRAKQGELSCDPSGMDERGDNDNAFREFIDHAFWREAIRISDR